MKAHRIIDFPKGPCLSEDELYSYLADSPKGRSLDDLEVHFSTCPECCGRLAQLLRLLSQESADHASSAAEVTDGEIADALAFISTVGRRTKRVALPRRLASRWASIAAAALAIIGSSFFILQHLYFENVRSKTLYDQARSQLEQIYAPQSPSGLRLTLPFASSTSQRDGPSNEALQNAESLFHQALGVRAENVEARLGLGYIYLSRTQLSKAQEQFQHILDRKNSDTRALLGRGTSLYEKAVASKDPEERISSLDRALADFETTLKIDPDSNEARFNKAATLFELGRHQDALEEIRSYLQKDSKSIWAERLRAIQTRILMNRSESVEEEVNRAARARDTPALETIARVVPYQVPAAIRSALRRGLEAEPLPPSAKTADATSLQWAAEILESGYSATTGDSSYRRLLDFYRRLTPAQRNIKRNLDSRFQKLVDLQRKGKLGEALKQSAALTRDFEKLQDYWQLVNTHHLRGNCFYYGTADFANATGEYKKMLSYAERCGNPDLICKALGAMGVTLHERQRFEDALSCFGRTQTVAAAFKLEPWSALASFYRAETYSKLNKSQDSLREYTSALATAFRLMDDHLAASTLEYVGDWMERSNRLQEARRFYADSWAIEDKLAKAPSHEAMPELTSRRLNLLYKQGILAFRMNDLTGAENYLKQAIESSNGTMRELEARIRLGLAQVYIEHFQMREAEQEIQACLRTMSPGEYPDLKWRTRCLEGIRLRKNGQPEQAIVQFQHAIGILERMRKHVSDSDLRHSFLVRRFDPYQQLVSVMFHLRKESDHVLEYVDRAKSMTLREYLGIQPGLRSPRLRRENRLAIVEYFLTPSEILIFAVLKSGSHSFSVPLSLVDIERNVGHYLESIRNNDEPAFITLSRQFHAQLVGPVMQLLKAEAPDGVVIIPDGPLHMLPFHSLQGPSGRYLLEEFPVSYAPSRSILRHCLDMERGDATSCNRSVVLLDGSSNLPEGSNELARLASLYGRKAYLLDAQDLSSLKQKVAQAEIIHFSGHSTIKDGRPRLVFPARGGEAYLEASVIASWNLAKNRLVSLAGCSTAVGPWAEGETPWGLLPAFLNAGSPALLASLLPVDDSAAKTLSCRFYDLLARGSIPKAKALQQAQISMLTDAHNRPARASLAWIPFVLVGDPR